MLSPGCNLDRTNGWPSTTDNARDELQVRLLPASAGTLVLVTSRSQLTGVAAARAATRPSLPRAALVDELRDASSRLNVNHFESK
jgi:hypothetical protein